MKDSLKPVSEKEHALCCFLDIYGFSANLLRDSEDLWDRLSTLVQELSKLILLRKPEGLEHYIFSDSVFMVLPMECPSDSCECASKLEGFLKLIALISSLGVASNLPIRGAISYGEMYIGNHTFAGIPVISAHNFEKHARIPLVFMPEQSANLAGEHCESVRQWFQRQVRKITSIGFRDGITSVFPILPDDTEAFLTKAKFERTTLLLDPSNARAALAWQDAIDIVEQHKKK